MVYLLHYGIFRKAGIEEYQLEKNRFKGHNGLSTSWYIERST